MGDTPNANGALLKQAADDSDGSGVLIATANHPFWVAGDISKWVDAADLKPGMWLRTSAGTYVQVSATEHETADDQRVHNLTIANHHTYYVEAGDTPVLVHNTKPCGPNLDAMSAAGRASDRNGLTDAGRAYQKHMSRGELPKVGGKELNSAGHNLLDDILTDPASDFQSIARGANKGGMRVISNKIINDQFVGAVYDADGNFKYFGLFS